MLFKVCGLIPHPNGSDWEETRIEFSHSLPNQHFVDERLAAFSENPLKECHYRFVWRSVAWYWGGTKKFCI